MNNPRQQVVVIGGGAAGFFGAIQAANIYPDLEIVILEGAPKVLGKVEISGGGRCNVTHACWEPAELVKFYPRGTKALLGPFHKFCTGDTYAWFEDQGVPLKIEEDNRVFPVSDNSRSIMDALENAARKAGIQVVTKSRVADFRPVEGRWEVETTSGETYPADAVLVAAGASPALWKVLARLGHSIVEPVPSLFTFNISHPLLKDLPGISVPDATVSIRSMKLTTNGPLLITHWGLSGPAVLKASAWGARKMNEVGYDFQVRVNWTGHLERKDCLELLKKTRQEDGKRKFPAHRPVELPSRLWARMAEVATRKTGSNWGDLSNGDLEALAEMVCDCPFEVKGKSTFKEEFVTAGGVKLKEVDFRSFESKLLPGLYLAGEILDIDALTGGFNFQAAWTGSWIAGSALAEALRD